MAYSDSFPAVRPVFQSDFANGGRIDPRISYSRSTTGTYFGTEKVLGSENLLLQSQSFDTTWLQNSGIATLTGSQSAPDGTSTAWLLTGSSASQNASIAQAVTLTTNTDYTLTVFLKAGTESHAYVSLRGSGSHSANALLDFSAGTATATDFGDFTSASQTVTALGSGWFKLTLSCTTGSTVSSSYVHIGPSDGTTVGSGGYLTYNAGGQTIYAWGAQLNTTGATVYDSPTTTQIAREYQTKLQTAAINAPRFEHSATDSASMGLLIEGSSTNLVTYSETLASGWTTNRSTLTAASGVAPDGTLTSNLWTVDGTASDSHNALFDFTTGGATPQTASIYAKAGNVNYLIMRFSPANGAFTDGYVSFNLLNGTVGTTNGTMASSSIESCGNGWFRCSITGTALTNATGRLALYIAQADNTISFNGNSYDHIQVWGAQVEANQSHPSSYISSNSGSATTRAADSASMDLTAAGFNGGAVSIVGEFAPVDASVGGSLRVLSLSDGSDTENIRTHMNNSRMYSVVRSGAANTAVGYNSNALNDGEAVKFGLAVDTNSLIASTSGFNSLGTTGAVLPDGATRLGIAQNNSGAQTLDSHWKSIRVFGEPLSLTNLQALTS